jgi:mannose-1-phosphate guanylyltransferase
MIVVHTGDATLICPKSRAEDVKKIVEKLREKGFDDYV